MGKVTGKTITSHCRVFADIWPFRVCIHAQLHVYKPYFPLKNQHALSSKVYLATPKDSKVLLVGQVGLPDWQYNNLSMSPSRPGLQNTPPPSKLFRRHNPE